MRVWRNWQTRQIQVLVATPCRFKSCHPHQNAVDALSSTAFFVIILLYRPFYLCRRLNFKENLIASYATFFICCKIRILHLLFCKIPQIMQARYLFRILLSIYIQMIFRFRKLFLAAQVICKYSRHLKNIKICIHHFRL